MNLNQTDIKPYVIFKNHTLPVTCLSISNNIDGYFASSSLDCTCNIYHIPSKSCLFSILFPNKVTALLYNNDNLFAGCSDGNIYYINLSFYSISQSCYSNNIFQNNRIQNDNNSKIQGPINANNSCITSLQLSIEDNILISGHENGEIVLWDNISKQLLKVINHHTSKITNILLMNKPNGISDTYNPSFEAVTFQKFLDKNLKNDISLSNPYKVYSECNLYDKNIICIGNNEKSSSNKILHEEKEETKNILISLNKELLSYSFDVTSKLIENNIK